ncbi:YsnF/AvaK domain-containing protein [Rufibacter latericius]|uniref:DUF2382 domain-containing protein n=1 Tax=Rufibacter latericius TaxID=2487040 RepID=A0A3M9N3M9_9BACT|nr:YsnF/AvaK domain-containing protein [Rufibacter latericius]RNI31618.1 DUF2382 domain-containing protein [Rufibacter latericius]
MAQTVVGIFDQTAEAEGAVQHLRSLGLSEANIDISRARTSVDATTASSTPSHHEGIKGFFRSLFHNNENHARTFSHVASYSESIVTVHAQTLEEAHLAAETLDRYGAIDVDLRAQEYGYAPDTSFPDDQVAEFTTDTPANNTTIPIVEENLQVDKREVATGGTRLRSRIVERPVEQHLRLRTEHIWIKRHPVNRPASEADFANFKEGEMELREHTEVPVINKEARVVEELSLGKEVYERNEVIRDTVRSTQVDTDNLDPDQTNLNTTRSGLDRDQTGRPYPDSSNSLSAL